MRWQLLLREARAHPFRASTWAKTISLSLASEHCSRSHASRAAAFRCVGVCLVTRMIRYRNSETRRSYGLRTTQKDGATSCPPARAKMGGFLRGGRCQDEHSCLRPLVLKRPQQYPSVRATFSMVVPGRGVTRVSARGPAHGWARTCVLGDVHELERGVFYAWELAARPLRVAPHLGRRETRSGAIERPGAPLGDMLLLLLLLAVVVLVVQRCRVGTMCYTEVHGWEQQEEEGGGEEPGHRGGCSLCLTLRGGT